MMNRTLKNLILSLTTLILLQASLLANAQSDARVVVIPLIEDAPEPAPKRAFVTSSVHTGNLAGVYGANTICQNLADAASLNGTFRAWLSTGGSISRYSPFRFFIKSDVPYVNMIGEQVAANWDDLVDGELDAQIRYTEQGAIAPPIPPNSAFRVWTYTRTDGMSRALDSGSTFQSCSGWIDNRPEGTGSYGNYRSTINWTTELVASCDNPSRLYCIEQ